MGAVIEGAGVQGSEHYYSYNLQRTVNNRPALHVDYHIYGRRSVPDDYVSC